MTSSVHEADRIRAERQLDAILDAYPNLSPVGFCQLPVDRRSPIDIYKQVHVEGFCWAREFLSLACRRLSSVQSRKSSDADVLKVRSEQAAVAIIGRQIEIGTGVLIAAAISLGIEVGREHQGSGTRVAVRVHWESRTP